MPNERCLLATTNEPICVVDGDEFDWSRVDVSKNEWSLSRGPKEGQLVYLSDFELISFGDCPDGTGCCAEPSGIWVNDPSHFSGLSTLIELPLTLVQQYPDPLCPCCIIRGSYALLGRVVKREIVVGASPLAKSTQFRLQTISWKLQRTH
jgi:hypothetical protein